MPVFEYKALNNKGKKVGGIITADGPAAARLKLSSDMIYPFDLKDVGDREKTSFAGTVASRLRELRRTNPAEVSASIRQLATLVSSGLPLMECLGTLVEQSEDQRLKKIFVQMKERVSEGRSLSDAMAEHPRVFNNIHVNMTRAGETGGALDIILSRLADYSEARMKLKKKVESALAYPIFLFFIAAIILIFLMTFIMPKVVGIFSGMELALPWSTRALIAITDAIKNYWWLMFLVTIIMIAGIGLWIRTEKGRRTWDRIRLRIPGFGTLHRKAVIARFTRTLSILLKSGILLVDAMEISRLSMGNRIVSDLVKKASNLVGEGQDLATPLKEKAGFPPLVVQLIRAGEQSGDLDSMLAKAAESYEDDVESTVAAMTSIVEPAIILFMGSIVGFIVLAILLPIFDMTSGIK
ncbi:type II secretion system inner membrane protein GspF [Thermodesulfobacteriota bacterium]